MISDKEMDEMELYVACVPINSANGKAIMMLGKVLLELKTLRKDTRSELQKIQDEIDFNEGVIR